MAFDGTVQSITPHAILRSIGFEPFAYQEEAWELNAAGLSGIIHVSTGSGKTYAATLASLAAISRGRRLEGSGRLGLLYVTPLRAVAHDITRALQAAVAAASLGLSVEERTGDTSAYRKRKQRDEMPDVLVTTPESLSLLLSHPGNEKRFGGVHTLVLDEWHELVGTKRGALLALAVSNVRGFVPSARVWVLSATLADAEAAARSAIGTATDFAVVSANVERTIEIEPLIPDGIDSFPWAGHLGLSMVEPLVRRLNPSRSTLIFTNTRNQAERWYLALSEAARDVAIGLHHGSVDSAIRGEVEERLRSGDLAWVVATSSLDLGIDFRPVEEVVHIGSVKSVSRLMQRAGRSGHRPGVPSRIVLVPTNALQLLEMLAIARGVVRRRIDPRPEMVNPIDVLLQHLLTIAAGDGLVPARVFEEVRSTVGFEHLNRREFDALVEFLEDGGNALSGYERYRKLEWSEETLSFRDEKLKRVHRMNIGTITANPHLRVAYTNGIEIGSIEEAFVSRLKKGDVFHFAGAALEMVMVQGETVRVRRASATRAVAARWPGGRLPISESLGALLREVLGEIASGEPARDLPWSSTVQAALRPIVDAQSRISRLPAESETLCEVWSDGSVFSLYVFPFEGSVVHHGLAALIAARLTKVRPASIVTSANEYGFSLRITAEGGGGATSEGGAGGDEDSGAEFEGLIGASLFDPKNVECELAECLNVSDMARTEFRDIAQIGGLVVRRIPGHNLRLRQIHASSSVLFDVFARYDPDNPLYREAFRTVLERQLDLDRLRRCMARICESRIVLVRTVRPSPLAFPLFAGDLSARVSNETTLDRIRRMIRRFEGA